MHKASNEEPPPAFLYRLDTFFEHMIQTYSQDQSRESFDIVDGNWDIFPMDSSLPVSRACSLLAIA